MKLKKWLNEDKDKWQEIRNGKFSSVDKKSIIFITLSGLILYLAWLGSFEFFDPWENHYSQVIKETMNHGSFLRLWYGNSNRFWSKPPLMFWFIMPFFATLKLFPEQFATMITEFVLRLPIALCGIIGLDFFYILLSRLMKRKAALVASFVLMMSPHFFTLSRQIMVDLPFIVFNTLAVLAIAVYYFAEIDDNQKTFFGKIDKRNSFIYMFYILEGFAFLSKGLLSIAMPGAIFFIYLVLTGDFGAFFSWRTFKKHLIGFFLYLAVIMPWFGYLLFDAGKVFFDTFIIFHHFKRAVGIIHKPNDLFTLYVKVIGYGMFPWVMFIPASFYHFFSKGKETFTNKKNIFLFSTVAGLFFFFAFQSTKFYHYIAPITPFIAIIIGKYLADFTERENTVGKKIEVITSLFLLAVVARDIGNKPSLLVNIFTFYHNRFRGRTADYRYIFPILITTLGIAVLLSIFYSRKKYKHITLPSFFICVAAFILYFNGSVLPKISTYYSIKPLITKYWELSPEREPIADYYKWNRKSSSFWLGSGGNFLNTDKEKKVLRFFSKPGKQYVILKNSDRKRLINLLRRINKTARIVKKIPSNILMVVEGKGTEIDHDKASKYIIKKLPSDTKPLNAVFDNSVKILGYKLLKGSENAKPGDKFLFEFYLSSIRSNIARDYMFFMHAEGDTGKMRTISDVEIADGIYPSPYWKKGDIIKQRISINIPRGNNPNSSYTIYGGLFQEDYRANITNNSDIPNDGDNRVIIMKTTLSK